MSRYLLRIATAVLSFSVSLFAVWASGYWNRFEDFVVERFGTESNLHNCFIYEPDFPLNYSTEKKSVYARVIKEFIKTDDETILVLAETTNYPFGLKQSSLELADNISTETAQSFAQSMTIDYPQTEIDTLKSYYFNNLESHSLSDLPAKVDIIASDLATSKESYKQYKIEKFTIDINNPLPSRFISLSNIGFNSNMTQAFVFVGLSDRTFVGNECFLLQRTHNGWVIKARVVISAMYFCG